MNWLNALNAHKQSNQSCVLVMITDVEGSAPREAGTRMLVSADSFYDTLGGGALELEAISHARALLSNGRRATTISHRKITLGSELSQCCGGRITLQFDCQFANTFVLHVFGAGHVAQEVARIVQRLPCLATFYDSRKSWLDRLLQCLSDGTPGTGDSCHSRTPGQFADASIACCLLGANTFEVVEACQPDAHYIVMTHSHELDFDLVEAILSRSDAAYCGLIASDSKALRFRNRLKRKGFTDSELASLTAPLGQGVQTGNTPMEVAVAAIGDVLTARQRSVQADGNADGRAMAGSSSAETS